MEIRDDILPLIKDSMPNIYFLTIELLVYSLFALCLLHAVRRGWAPAWQLIAGVIFGWLLEWNTIQQFHAYVYGHFLVMLGDVPLPIGVAWGVIIYSARQFSDAADLPEWARPVLDALLALNIDLSMDAIAIRLGFWHWGIAIDQQYFGVPYGNFWAWFWVIFFFSLGLRLVTRWRFFLSSIATPLAAVIIAIAGIVGMNLLLSQAASYQVYFTTIALVLTGALLLMVVLRPRFHVRPEPALATWVPAAFHIYFLAAGLISGVIFHPPILLFFSLSMAALSFLLHLHRPVPSHLAEGESPV